MNIGRLSAITIEYAAVLVSRARLTTRLTTPVLTTCTAFVDSFILVDKVRRFSKGSLSKITLEKDVT